MKNHSRLGVPNKNNFEPGSVEHRVINSVERLGLDHERSVLVGSAALVLYGIKLPQYDASFPDKPVVRPSDVDLTVDASHFVELYEAGQTPTGVPLRYKSENANKNFHILTAEGNPDADLLPADIITRFNPDDGSIQRFDRGFRKHYQSRSLVIPGTSGVRLASVDHLHGTLKQQSLDPKYAHDLSAFNRRVHDANRR